MSREALRGSIQKWINIRDNGGEDQGRFNCPLCEEYNTRVDPCHGCPIAHREPDSFIRFCDGTPYKEWIQLAGVNAREGVRSLRDAANPTEAREIADRMVKVLEELEIRYVET